MRDFNFQICEKHLQKRVKELPYIWGGKQNDHVDKATRKITKIRSYKELLQNFKDKPENIQNYAYNRWLNYWSAFAVEHFFIYNPFIDVKEESFSQHKTIDFYLNNTPFDHKTSKIPQIFQHRKDNLEDPQFKAEVIKWLYKNQSKQQRFHQSNRIFVVLFDRENPEDSWKMKAELSLIQQNIQQYLKELKSGQRHWFYNTINNEIIYSDIIWVVK